MYLGRRSTPTSTQRPCSLLGAPCFAPLSSFNPSHLQAAASQRAAPQAYQYELPIHQLYVGDQSTAVSGLERTRSGTQTLFRFRRQNGSVPDWSHRARQLGCDSHHSAQLCLRSTRHRPQGLDPRLGRRLGLAPTGRRRDRPRRRPSFGARDRPGRALRGQELYGTRAVRRAMFK